MTYFEKVLPKLRVARPTDRMHEITRFYRDGLGLEELGSFQNHEGFDGIILGSTMAPYHLEFTLRHDHNVGNAPSKDNLLVFYMPNQSSWELAVSRMKENGFEPVTSFNPYWDRSGKTFEDPDGYRVVLQNASWNI